MARERSVEPAILLWGQSSASGVDDSQGGQIEVILGIDFGHFQFQKVSRRGSEVCNGMTLAYTKQLLSIGKHWASIVAAEAFSRDADGPSLEWTYTIVVAPLRLAYECQHAR